MFDERGQRIGAGSRADGQPVESGGVGTMSKSKNNGIDPQALIDEYGADTARLFMMFASPPEQSLEWSDAGVEGAFRFLKRLWTFLRAVPARVERAGDAGAAADAPEHADLRREVHAVLKQANYDFQKFQFNTVVSAAMKILNALERASRAGGCRRSRVPGGPRAGGARKPVHPAAPAGADHAARGLPSLARARPGSRRRGAGCIPRALAGRRRNRAQAG